MHNCIIVNFELIIIQYNLKFLQDYIFITEQKKKQLIVYSKENGVLDVSFSLGEANPHDVIMYDDTQQPMSTCKLI